MSEEIITMLSNMGALDEDKAVSRKILNNSERLKNQLLDDDIKSLEDRGYVVRVDDRLYLTQSGLVRALSNFS
ncbi:MAG: hypothetical protein OK439_00505 [Thaumarchaeota archaeon]|nr:hypothetical protein [Nitrososphaerota archaeon]